MSGIRDIKRKMVSVQNTQKITRAMEMVSAAKMRRASDAIEATKPYAEKIKEVVTNISTGTSVSHPLLKVSEKVDTVALLAISSDKGLCGGFNSNVIKLVSGFKAENPNKKLKLYIIGKKTYDFYKRRDYTIVKNWTDVAGQVTFIASRDISRDLSNAFINNEFQEIYILYNQMISGSTQVPAKMKLLPLSLSGIIDEADDAINTSNATQANIREYKFEPSPQELLKGLLPKYIEFSVYSKLLESAAGEHSARMMAMGNATRNAEDMVKELQLNYNKARQAAITTDLLDIINGAEALK